MEKPKFEVGKIYTNHSNQFQLRFVGKNAHDCLVFEPVNNTHGPFTPYNEIDELFDPICKKGYVGFVTGNSLQEYKP